jgi:hypothetical protein
MKEFTFTAYCSYGKGDSGESWVDVELTDEEAERLIKYGTDPDIYYNDFENCEELKDLYQKIYALAVKQMTEELREFGDLEEKYASDPNWKVDDLYHCGVNFPKEFENMLDEEK